MHETAELPGLGEGALDRPGMSTADRPRRAAAALTGGYHLAFWIAAGLVGLAIVVAGTVLRSGD
jgi:hypothetical protein